MNQHTKGRMCAVAMGGSSTVLIDTKPVRNDTRIPPFGYDDKAGHCIAYPFLDDDDRPRLDFVCFSHADARRLAAAWNAVDGVPVEILEANQSGGLPWVFADQLERRMQMRALVDAAKALAEASFKIMPGELIAAVNAAIAKANLP